MTDYRLISSDSHVTMPDDAWQEYLDPEFRDRAPASSAPTRATSASSRVAGRRS